MPSASSTADFFARLQGGLEVAAVAAGPEELFGVRQGFVRYFHQGLRRALPVAVVPHGGEEGRAGLSASDDETLERIRRRAHGLEHELGDAYSFYVATAGGLHSVSAGGRDACFVRCWTVVCGPLGEAWGASGSLQIPELMLSGSGEGGRNLGGVGTRRRGGLVSSLTARLEDRRSAVALATFHALSTLFYGRLEA